MSNITGNMALVKNFTGNKPVPLLIFLSASLVSDKATRQFSTGQLPVIYSAMVMVSEPGLSKFNKNILFMLKPSTIPIKSFTDEVAAKQWLKLPI